MVGVGECGGGGGFCGASWVGSASFVDFFSRGRWRGSANWEYRPVKTDMGDRAIQELEKMGVDLNLRWLEVEESVRGLQSLVRMRSREREFC